MADEALAARLRHVDALRREYPNCATLDVPPEAVEGWSFRELRFFFESMGLVRPNSATEKAAAEKVWREKLEQDREERTWRTAARGPRLVCLPWSRVGAAETASRRRGRRRRW